MAEPNQLVGKAVKLLSQSHQVSRNKISMLMEKNQELIDNVNKQTFALQKVTELVGSLMQRIEAVEHIANALMQEQQDQEDAAELQRLAGELSTLLAGAGGEIDPIMTAPPLYTPPETENGDGAEASAPE